MILHRKLTLPQTEKSLNSEKGEHFLLCTEPFSKRNYKNTLTTNKKNDTILNRFRIVHTLTTHNNNPMAKKALYMRFMWCGVYYQTQTN